MLQHKVLSVRRLNEPEQRFLNLWELVYTDHKGKERKWQFASRNNPPTPEELPKCNAVICVCRYQDRLIIIKETRVVVGGDEWGFVAGLKSETESYEDAARREIKEETGLDLVRITRISPITPSSAGLSDEGAAYVFCEVEGTPCLDHLEEGECIETFLMTYDEVVKLCRREAPYDTGCVSGRAWPVLYMYEQLGGFVWTGPTG